MSLNFQWEIVWAAVGAIAALGSLVWAIWERRARKLSDKKLEEIKNRADAPFLAVSDVVFGYIYQPFDQGELRFWNQGSPNVLCFCRNQVDTAQNGIPVILVVDVTGEPARSILLKLDSEKIALKREADVQDAKGLFFIEYPYCLAKQGKEQQITITFETNSGVQNTHKYLTRHGIRFLERIDPALPH